ncbi:hypothetical protein BS47DRAFT_1356993 [Hydnum rufescens UP504]|uniref:Uncharacterized protein n=1 Tax=Hydnum rufescens UP504 TaxID=1448309 RepID=A0A9P6BB14_9AGAM|nr:hypothetical protein BS47DRAFT_1356993 [Hydnum rufescens UP504]
MPPVPHTRPSGCVVLLAMQKEQRKLLLLRAFEFLFINELIYSLRKTRHNPQHTPPQHRAPAEKSGTITRQDDNQTTNRQHIQTSTWKDPKTATRANSAHGDVTTRPNATATTQPRKRVVLCHYHTAPASYRDVYVEPSRAPKRRLQRPHTCPSGGCVRMKHGNAE